MKQRIYFFIISFTLLSSCKTTKSVSKIKETNKIDSVFIYREKEIVKRFTDTLTIKEPCDTITGKLKPFKRIISVPQGDILLEGVNNIFTANIDLNGYEKTVEKKYQLMYEQRLSEIKESKVKYKNPFIHWLIHLICALFIILLLRN
jgi:hypothetical protein